MKKVLRLTWSRKLLDNEKKFKDSSLSIWGIDVDFLCYFDIYYQNGFRYINNWKLINEYDLYWVWWIKWISMFKWFLYKLWKLEWKKIIDEQKKSFLCNDKFTQVLFCEHYWFNIPKTLFFLSSDENTNKIIQILEKSLQYPLIAKLPNIDKWDGVFLINDIEWLESLLKNNLWEWFLFQEKIENTWDYRVITIWEKVLWAIKRYNPNDYRNNVWKWWTSQEANIPDFIKNISVDITKKFDLSISWIDYFITDDNYYYIIEINDLPQYSWFEQATWLSYSKEVMMYFKNLLN